MTDEELIAVLRWQGSALQDGAFFAVADRIEALTAERDRLRGALKAIAAGVGEDFDEATQQNVTAWMSDEDMQEIARAALKGETP